MWMSFAIYCQKLEETVEEYPILTKLDVLMELVLSFINSICCPRGWFLSAYSCCARCHYFIFSIKYNYVKYYEIWLAYFEVIRICIVLIYYCYLYCLSLDKVDAVSAQKLLRDILDVFDVVLLPTHASRYVQFVVFYICSFGEVETI